jgi:Flp pilus assembly protein TadG
MRLVRSESGAALVEFAVVAPVLLLLLLGLIDFGRYMYDGILAANAARAGAQYGAQTMITAANSAGMQNAAYADAQNLPGMTVNNATYFCANSSGTTVTCGTAGAIAYVKVTTTGQFTPIIKYPLLPSSVPVSGSSIIRVEQQ